ncbi:UDP-N-acetylmuramoyl-tripeptide--D-alanyl-D-alanine ligase [bacterium HR19]|nr:UDP-N-acetylmuramoyl-tripeptide--D-alanyl-D-alanine ligase [bacterium HR19]
MIELPFELTLREISQICEGKIFQPRNDSQSSDELKIKYLSLDTREQVSECLFVPIKGSRFDGHDFIEEAQKKGAKATIFSDYEKIKKLNLSIPCIFVEDTKEAFLKLSSYIRKRVNPLVIAVGGSAGKTTTKELIYFMLNCSGLSVHKSKKSFNNEIGVSISMSSLKKDTEIAVFEIGTSSLGEIEKLTKFVEPDFGVLVSYGKEHLEGLRSPEFILKEETYLTDFVAGKDGAVFINIGIEELKDYFLRLNFHKKVGFLMPLQKNQKKISKEKFFGFIEPELLKMPRFDFVLVYPCNVSRKFETEFGIYVSFSGEKKEFHIRTNLAPHFGSNLASALSVFIFFFHYVKGENFERIINERIQKINFFDFKNESSRFNVFDLGKFVVVDDSYNSNPLSLSALFYSAGFQKGKKVFVIGDMLELGEFSATEHLKIGEVADMYLEKDSSFFFISGEFEKYMEEGLRRKGFQVSVFKKNDELFESLRKIDFDFIFFKASRARKFDLIARDFINNFKPS